MTAKIKKILYALLLAAVVIFGYCLWLSLRPVEIVAVHQDGNSSDVLVKNFPFTDRGKMSWWLKNKNMLKEKYGVPAPDEDGFFEVIFWYFGDGYKETDGYDNLCFGDMKPPINCIEKDKAFTVWNNKRKHVFFGVHDGFYQIQENGKKVKTKYH